MYRKRSSQWTSFHKAKLLWQFLPCKTLCLEDAMKLILFKPTPYQFPQKLVLWLFSPFLIRFPSTQVSKVLSLSLVDKVWNDDKYDFNDSFPLKLMIRFLVKKWGTRNGCQNSYPFLKDQALNSLYKARLNQTKHSYN